MRLHERTMLVQKASAHIRSRLLDMQETEDLTDIEMLQVLAEYQASILKWMLRTERHPDDPDRGGDEE